MTDFPSFQKQRQLSEIISKSSIGSDLMVNHIATAQWHVPQIHIRTFVNQSKLNCVTLGSGRLQEFILFVGVAQK